MTYVNEGWWSPNVKSGQVHGHNPNQPGTMHRECEPVYTKRGDDQKAVPVGVLKVALDDFEALTALPDTLGAIFWKELELLVKTYEEEGTE